MKLVEKSGKQLRYMFNSRMPITKGCPLGSECKVCDNDAVKCSSRGVVYLAECSECQDVITENAQSVFNLSDSWYVGETSRPLRMRAKEHWGKLADLDTHSFMLTHWMKAHGLSMCPPKYTFKVLGTYTDSLSRQIAEAIHIETKGILNKRSEFGTNHIPRLEAMKSERDRDIFLEKEARDKANLLCDLVCFKNVITNVIEIEEKSNALPNSISSTYRSKKNIKTSNGKRSLLGRDEKTLTSDSAYVEGLLRRKRRRTNMLASTPIWERREANPSETSPASHDSSTVILDFSGGSFCKETLVTPVQDCTGGDNSDIGGELKKVGLTPELKNLLIRPKNEDDYTQMKKFLEETINLTRAAILRGLIEKPLNMSEFSIKLRENSLYRPFNIVDPMARIFKNLNLDDWKQDDIGCLETLNRSVTRKRKSVLVDDLLVNELENFSSKQSVLDKIVDKIILESVEVTGIETSVKLDSLKDNARLGSMKRKHKLSPDVAKVEQALKFQRGHQTDVGSSPALKIRTGLNTKVKSPPAGGDLKSPACGRIQKLIKRRLTTPKRSYTPDRRQILITSVFSPKTPVADRR